LVKLSGLRSAPHRLVAFVILVALSACAKAPTEVDPLKDPPGTVEGYGVLMDAEYALPAIPPQYLDPPNRKAEVSYAGGEGPGTIVIDPFAKFLYLIGEGGTATRYPIAVGREGKGFRGDAVVGDMKFWPGWTPTANMVRREPEVYGPFAGGIPGGLASPLGARALYLYRGSRDTHYRIHGTNDLESIGNAGSAGCIRLFNHDVIDLFGRVSNGTRVHVRSIEESTALEDPANVNRGVELPPKIVPPEDVYGGAQAQGDPLPDTTTDVFTVIN
jgi:lipoprotein-anchoring transpeptidase ErfK/SrfK